MNTTEVLDYICFMQNKIRDLENKISENIKEVYNLKNKNQELENIVKEYREGELVNELLNECGKGLKEEKSISEDIPF